MAEAASSHHVLFARLPTSLESAIFSSLHLLGRLASPNANPRGSHCCYHKLMTVSLDNWYVSSPLLC